MQKENECHDFVCTSYNTFKAKSNSHVQNHLIMNSFFIDIFIWNAMLICGPCIYKIGNPLQKWNWDLLLPFLVLHFPYS